jgi:hypothetical protein
MRLRWQGIRRGEGRLRMRGWSRAPDRWQPCLLAPTVFLKESSSTAISFKKESNCTSRVEANNTTREQRMQQDTTPPQPGRRVKRSHRKPRRCHQRRATPEAATRCKLQQPPELLHLELSPASRSHMIVDPSAPTMLRQNTPIEVPKKTTEPGHTLCVGGLASPTASHSSAKDSYT